MSAEEITSMLVGWAGVVLLNFWWIWIPLWILSATDPSRWREE